MTMGALARWRVWVEPSKRWIWRPSRAVKQRGVVGGDEVDEVELEGLFVAVGL